MYVICRDHVFLDPDTGIRLKPCNTLNAPRYLFGPELVAIADARPENLTLVFDQSLQGAKSVNRFRTKWPPLRSMAFYQSHTFPMPAYPSGQRSESARVGVQGTEEEIPFTRKPLLIMEDNKQSAVKLNCLARHDEPNRGKTMNDLRQQLISTALEWERAFGNAPLITSALSRI
jgi:hypothetical protein